MRIYNTPHPELLDERLRQLSLGGKRPVELVFASASLREQSGLPGTVQDSIVDVERFSPGPRPPGEHGGPDGRFVVGRASRDVAYKHAEGDLDVYRRLADFGCEVRVAGGTCLRGMMPEHPHVALLPLIRQADLPAFLRGLDCFLYRALSQWYETFGRVMEAMACGLPVVCERRSGAAEYIEHGETGFLIETDEEAVDAVLVLKRDPSLRARIGAAARRAVEERYSRENIAAIRSFYLGDHA